MLAEDWGQTMWRASWQAGLLALLVWGVCRVWRRMPAGLGAGLWIVVCAKLLVGLLPVAVALPVLPPETVSTVSYVPSENYFQPVSVSETFASLPPPPVSPWVYVALAWGAGVLAMTVLLGVAVARIRRIVRRSQPLAIDGVAELAKGMGLRLPRVLVTQEEVGALTLGVFRPTILLSQSTLDGCTEDELRLILAHELAHLQRRDAWWALLPQAATVLFFFHPFAWLAVREYGLAREAACDEIAIETVGARSDAYGRLLLKLGAQREFGSPLLVARMSSHFRNLHRRITMLDRITSSPRRLKARAALVAGIAAVALIMPWNLVRAEAATPPATLAASDPIPTLWKGSTSTKWAFPKVQAKVGSKEWLKGKTISTTHLAKHIDAYALAKQLGKEFPSTSIQILVDPRVNAVFVMANATDTGRIVKRMKQLDKPSAPVKKPELPAQTTPEPEMIVRKVDLQYAPASEVALALNRLFTDIKFNVVVEPGQNSLVFRGTPERVAKLISIASAFDRPKDKPADPATNETVQRVFTVRNLAAHLVLEDLRADIQMAKIEMAFVDTLDQNITLRGLKPEVEKLGAKIVAMDAKAPTKGQAKVLRRYPLRHTSAKEIAEVVKREWADRADFISYDPTDNSLVIRTTEDQVDRLTEYIRRLDVIPPTG